MSCIIFGIVEYAEIDYAFYFDDILCYAAGVVARRFWERILRAGCQWDCV